MRLERDSIPLDKEFPFQISEVELNPSNSQDVYKRQSGDQAERLSFSAISQQ